MTKDETDVLVEVVYDYKTYRIPESVLKTADVLKMPDGVFINLKLTGIEYDFTVIPYRLRLIGATSDYEARGEFPTLKVAEAGEQQVVQRIN